MAFVYDESLLYGRRRWRVADLLLSLLITLLASGCAGTAPHPAPPATPHISMAWQGVDSLNARLPAGVRLFAGRNDTLPLRAWYVWIDEADPEIETRVVVADDPADRRAAGTRFAQDLDACVVVNGGYFTMNQTPAKAVGLLVRDGAVLAPATATTERDGRPYETARAALGFTADGRIEVTWATTRGDTVWAWAAPPAHAPGRPAPPLAYTEALPWPVRDALGAGPALLQDGSPQVTDDEEVFFGTSIPAVHPRTAAGRTADGALVVMVVDGRQDESRGVSLGELAALLQDVGVVDGLNLDGGGSSTLVVDGVLVNRPTGGTFEREVMSALATSCGE